MNDAEGRTGGEACDPVSIRPEGGLPGSQSVMQRLHAGAEVSWKEFLEACSGTILTAVRHLGSSHDERMDMFLFVCESLRADGMRRVRSFRFRPDAPCRFTTYLTVVVRNLALDYRRSRRGRFRMFRNLGAVDEVDRIVGDYRLRDGRSAGEIRDLLRNRHGISLADAEVAERIARLERSLSASQRWRVLTRWAARRPPVSIDPVHEVASEALRPVPLAANDGDPERGVFDREATRAMTRAVAALPARQRLVLALRYRDGLDVAPTARTLGATPAQVERLTREALETIRAGLGAARVTREALEGGLGAWWLSWETRP